MNKKWYQSKTVWTAIITGVVGVLDAVGVKIPPEAYAVLAALGLYSVRSAIG